MVKKIIVIEVVEHVYTPDLEGPNSVYVEHDIKTIEEAVEMDKQDVEDGAAQMHELADESKVISRNWRIIDEP